MSTFGATERNPRWAGDTPGYDAVHKRLRRQRGRAASHRCRCGSLAAQWAYIHGDPRELRQMLVIRGKATSLAYTPDLSRYAPMCKPCHRRYDLGGRS